MRSTVLLSMMKAAKSPTRFALFVTGKIKKKRMTDWKHYWRLEAASYPISDFDIHPFIQNEVQIFATLLATSINSEELDQIVEQLVSCGSVSQAF